MRLTTDPLIAARALADGHLAAVPTETVYGLGARADDPHAIARVYAAKGRPADHPLIAHLATPEALDAWGEAIPDYARQLTAAFWPGPLTIVVRRTSRALDAITGGQDTVALRVSSHPVMQAALARLAEITDDPAIAVAAPSANRFGKVSPTTAGHVERELGEHLQSGDVVLDGGECAVGVESTIVDCTREIPHLLRPGAITAEDITEITGLTCGTQSTVRASGTLASHYAPAARVRIVETTDDRTAGISTNRMHANDDARIGLLALAAVPTPDGVVRLAAPQDADEYARVLYAALREADALDLREVVAVPPPAQGIGIAVRDRLRRAATPSDQE